MRQFILKTHPDYFHNDVIKKQTNAASLQKLNNILQNSKPIDSTTKLDFYIKGHKNLKKTGIFNAKDSSWFKISSFFQLCKQADIPVLQSDIDLVEGETTRELNKHRKKYKSLSQEFAEKLYQHQDSTFKSYEPNDILRNKLIMFGPSVNKLKMAEKLCLWLPQLEPQAWLGKIPLLILSSNTPLPPKEANNGVLIIHDDMDLKGKVNTDMQ